MLVTNLLLRRLILDDVIMKHVVDPCSGTVVHFSNMATFLKPEALDLSHLSLLIFQLVILSVLSNRKLPIKQSLAYNAVSVLKVPSQCTIRGCDSQSGIWVL